MPPIPQDPLPQTHLTLVWGLVLQLVQKQYALSILTVQNNKS